MADKNTPIVAFVGQGSMGLGMAKNLLKHGHKVIGVDPSAPAREAFTAAGGTIAGSPGDIASQADVVVVAVVNAQQVDTVLHGDGGAAATLRKGGLVMQCATVPPAFAKAAIPMNWLATESTFTQNGVAPGEEMMALGFPKGLSSNSAGFPILRAGRVDGGLLVREHLVERLPRDAGPGDDLGHGGVGIAEFAHRLRGGVQQAPGLRAADLLAAERVPVPGQSAQGRAHAGLRC